MIQRDNIHWKQEKAKITAVFPRKSSKSAPSSRPRKTGTNSGALQLPDMVTPPRTGGRRNLAVIFVSGGLPRKFKARPGTEREVWLGTENGASRGISEASV